MSSPSVSVVATAVRTSSFRAALPRKYFPIRDRIRIVFLIVSIPLIFIVAAGVSTMIYKAALVPD